MATETQQEAIAIQKGGSIDVCCRTPVKLYRAILKEKIKARTKGQGQKIYNKDISRFYFRAKNLEHATEQAGLVCDEILRVSLKSVEEANPKDISGRVVTYFPNLNERFARAFYNAFNK